jgi:hypothetical protein
MTRAHLTPDACVATCGRSLTHVDVRSLSSSVASSPRIVSQAWGTLP